MKLLAGLLALVACASCAPDADTLRVFAASSLQGALDEIAASYERERGVRVELNYAGSGTLAVQIEQGGGCDLFLSAGDAEMDRLEARGLIDATTRVALLSNELVVIVRRGGHLIVTPDQLARQTLTHLAIANPDSVPAGRYARAWMRGVSVEVNAGDEPVTLWSLVESRVVPASNVRAALAAVESGAADAGIVYRTDAALSDAVVVSYTVRGDRGPVIEYPAAVTRDGPRARLAREFLAALREDRSRAVFRGRGFAILGDETGD